MRVKGTVVFGFILLAFVLTTVIMAFTYPPRARLVPLVIGLPTVAMLLYAIIGEQWLPSIIRRFDVSISDFAPVLKDQEAEKQVEQLAEEGAEYDQENLAPGHHGEADEAKRIFRILGWMAAFIVSIFFFGFFICVPIYTFIFLKLQAKASWLAAILITVILFAFVYVLFGQFFPAGLFPGWVFDGFVPPL